MKTKAFIGSKQNDPPVLFTVLPATMPGKNQLASKYTSYLDHFA
jgi:hypothetical protein